MILSNDIVKIKSLVRWWKYRNIPIFHSSKKLFNIRMNHIFHIALIILYMANINYAISQIKPGSTAINAKKQILFEKDDLLYIYILANFDSLLNDRSDSAEFHNAKLWYYDKYCGKTKLNIKLRTRGNFRLKREHCEFPPLRIKFYKGEINGTLFHDQEKIKMVTHCLADIYVLREYIIYIIYNILTEKSYNVRLAQLHYINSGLIKDTTINYAFFLENSKLMALRNGGKTIKNQKISKDELDLNYVTILYLYQFMIGNTDWDIDLIKNIKFIDINRYDRIIPVPYDFDWSEIVDAPYTNIGAYVGNEPWNKRKMKNLERSDEELKIAFKYFISKKEEIYNLITDFQYLSYSESRIILDYLDVFYSIVEKRNLTKKRFLKLIDRKIVDNQD